MLRTFNLEKLRTREENEVNSLQSYLSNVDQKLRNGHKVDFNLFSIADAICQAPGAIDEFTDGFNREYFGKSSGQRVQFNLLSDDQVKAQYDNTLTSGNLDSVIGTDILPTVEALIKDTSILSRMNIKTVSRADKVHRMNDWDEEKDGENLAETAASTDTDDVHRKGDLLQPTTKVQASATFSELGISVMTNADFGVAIARLVKRIKNKIIVNVLYNGQSAANGTAREVGTPRGIVNNYGVNGIGDNTNYIGAIQYATKAAADAAIQTKGGTASTDAYDLCVKMKSNLLPENLTEVEEDDYVFIAGRSTWGTIKTVPDLNGRYKARSAVNPATGKVTNYVDDTEFIKLPHVDQGFVFLVPLKLVTVVLLKGIMSLNDGGLVELREGNITFVARTYMDCSMNYGHKYKKTTAATIGTTTVDNQEQNAFRYFRIS